MNQKVMLLLGLVVPFAIAGCNTNPVAVPKSEDTPLLFEQEAISQSSKVDLLWMIDNSGSMAEEQAAIASQLPGLAQALSLIDFRLAVTSTGGSGKESQSENCKGADSTNKCKSGQFRNRAWVQLSSSGVYTAAKIRDIFKPAFDNCLDSSYDASKIQSLKDKLEAKIKELGGDDQLNVKLASDTDRTTAVEALNGILPPNSAFREIGPVLSSENYPKDGTGRALSSVGQEQLQKDLICLSLVGTNGWGIEQGLAAVVNAVDKDGPNKADPLITPGRSGAKLALLLVTDENDCSHAVVKNWNGTGKNRDMTTVCAAATCNLFNTYGYDDKKNPLRSPKSLYEAFLSNLRKAKNEPNYNQNLVYAFAITGTALPQPRQTSGGFSREAAKAVEDAGTPSEQVTCSGDVCTITNKTIAPDNKNPIGGGLFTPNSIDKWGVVWSDSTGGSFDMLCKSTGRATEFTPTSTVQGEMRACTSALGTSVSGDRYYRFIEGFEHRYPANAGEVGAMCGNDFSNVFKVVVGLVSGESGECLQQKLLPCEEGAAVGSNCGPDGSGGVCIPYANSGTNQEQHKGLFCSAAVQPLLLCSDKNSFDQLKGALCRPDSGSDTSCLLKPDAYNLNEACDGGVGVRFKFADPSKKKEVDDKGCSVKLDFSAFETDPSDN